MDNLQKHLRQFPGKKILVFGDLMLDEHIWSKVSRISPEAPVPIADVVRISHVPGGCGNVAANIAALRGIPLLVGIIGRDSSADKLTRALKQAGVSPSYLLTDPDRPTILKSRLIAASQQMVRVDREDRTLVSPQLAQKVMARLRTLVPQADAVIISDYEKGLVTPALCQFLIKLAKRYRKPVAIDPKGLDYAKYRGAFVLTPNLKETALAARLVINNEPSLLRAGQKLLREVKSRYLLVTRGKEGLTLFDGRKVTQVPAIAREVFDVTGAGDAVIATLSLALAAGAPINKSCSLANQAGSIVVGKVGTAPCSFEELEVALEGREPTARKIKLRPEIAVVARELRAAGNKLVFTNGCFDILHLGHVRYLHEAKKLGDILIVGVNTDASVTALKGPERPYASEMERAEILASLECVDYVVLFNELRPDNLIKAVRPDVHVKGGDYQVNALPEKKLVESLGGRVVVIPPIKGRSTTNIVAKILGRK
ncbi:MAG: D-glycero-beta-D-manno-heptose-7-phosphate kinase [Candidatus Margulisbacteria bacterium]|jgi:D-beta-D-heptose 7-phosphate kinase/D-beta-D-heptose 1-phosphate adenosyltransferase|nr:D-glycero-beta-D-manno-heptose-7-phosphate kinase [Candidatus Margulisiibacteriota bacterium]